MFGAEGTFDVQSDEEGGQIFLKVTSGSYLDAHPIKLSTITIITESGLTQDLRITPVYFSIDLRERKIVQFNELSQIMYRIINEKHRF